jgi:polyhydroxyalkanoate synthase
MQPTLWGFPGAGPIPQQAQRDLERFQQRCGAVCQAVLDAAARRSAQTPSDLVYAEGAARVLRYRPLVARPLPAPLLVVPSMLSSYAIFDLTSGAGLVEYLLRQGLDVFVLDWGEPGPAERRITLDEYIAGVMRRAAQRVRAAARSGPVSLLGYSMGGTFAAIWAALHPDELRCLVQLAAPINFHDDGLLSQWTRKDRFNADLVVDTLSAMPPALMQASFKMLTPAAQILQQAALAEQLGDLEALQDLLAAQSWIGNMPLFLGEAYRKWIKECYQENYLVQGKLVIDGRRVDLTRIRAPLLTAVGARDGLCPPQSAALLNHLVSSPDRHLLELPCGHTGLVAGRTASELLWPRLAAWLAERSG